MFKNVSKLYNIWVFVVIKVQSVYINYANSALCKNEFDSTIIEEKQYQNFYSYGNALKNGFAARWGQCLMLDAEASVFYKLKLMLLPLIMSHKSKIQKANRLYIGKKGLNERPGFFCLGSLTLNKKWSLPSIRMEFRSIFD